MKYLWNDTDTARRWIVDGHECEVGAGEVLVLPDALARSFPVTYTMREVSALPPGRTARHPVPPPAPPVVETEREVLTVRVEQPLFSDESRVVVDSTVRPVAGAAETPTDDALPVDAAAQLRRRRAKRGE